MIKKIVAVSIALCLTFSMTVFAQQSPEFARTAEQWATLRDNNLEYGEIADLVHEYNPTVLQNYSTYNTEKDQTSTDISQTYYDQASSMLDGLELPDESSANYAQELSSYYNRQIQYENLMKQGDTNTNDSATKKLNYDKQEAELVKQAQSYMINYWTQASNISSLEASVQTAQEDLQTVTDKYNAGMALSSDVSSANQKVTQAEAQLVSAQSSLAEAKEKLCLMLGWEYGDEVNIGAIPSVSAEEIAAINLTNDIETAKTNNYSYQILSKQYNNATTTTSKDSLASSKATAEQNIANNVSSLYNALLLAQSNYDQANGALSNQNKALATAQRKLSAGLLTQKGYDQVAAALTSSNSSLESKRLALVTAYNNYKWAVNGLASN